LNPVNPSIATTSMASRHVWGLFTVEGVVRVGASVPG